MEEVEGRSVALKFRKDLLKMTLFQPVPPTITTLSSLVLEDDGNLLNSDLMVGSFNAFSNTRRACLKRQDEGEEITKWDDLF